MEIKTYLLDCSPLADTTLYRAALEILPAWRRAKAATIKNEEECRRSVSGGLLLRAALGAYDLENMAFGAHGKPYLPDCPVHFNLSHSGDWVALSLSSAPVGCDIQEIRPYQPALAKRFFSEKEQAMLEAATDKQRCFFRLWTLKESYIKAMGAGLAMPLATFTAGETAGCFYQEYTLQAPYCLAVCSRGEAAFAAQPLYKNVEELV